MLAPSTMEIGARSRPVKWMERSLAVALLALAALDLATAAVGGGGPYLSAGAPATILGAAARAAAAGLAASALLTGRRPGLRGFAGVVVFGLVSLWAPRPVWLYTARHPAFDPFAPALANLLHVAGLSLLAGAFLRAASGRPRPSAGFWARQWRGGVLARLAVIAPLLGYRVQVEQMMGELSSTGRELLIVVGGVWLALFAGCFVVGLVSVTRRAARHGDLDARANAGVALRALAFAVALYLLVRALSGDLWMWAGSVLEDFAKPYGPFSLFAVRASAADTPGTVGFSCALLALAGTLASRGRAERLVKP